MARSTLRTSIVATVLVSLLAQVVSSQVVAVTPFAGSQQEGFEGTHSPSFQSCVQFRLFNERADLCTPGATSSLITSGWIATCGIFRRNGNKLFGTAPKLSGSPTWAEYTFDVPVQAFGGYFGNNLGTSTVTVDFLDSGGVLIDSHVADVPADCGWHWNGWATTGPTFSIVRIRNSLAGGGNILMDDMVIEEGPDLGCELLAPASPVTDQASLGLRITSRFIPDADANFEFTLDGGSTWRPATSAPPSPLLNPAEMVPVGLQQDFIWDTRDDGVGFGLIATGVQVRATVVDTVSGLTSTCTTMPFDVDNTVPFCVGECGDCDQDRSAPDIVDAVTAALIAVGTLSPNMGQVGCCDVNGSGVVEVLDALRIAQFSMGLPAQLLCN